MEPNIKPVYKVVDDCVMHADVYLPTEKHTRQLRTKCPVVIVVHGGAYVMGSSRIISFDEVHDCLCRGWIVVVPEFRLCPQVDILSGPVTDVRDCLLWIHNKLNDIIINHYPSALISADTSRIVAYGMCSGAAIAGCLGFGVPKPVCAVLCSYSSLNFTHPMWKSPFEAVRLPENSTVGFINQVYHEKPVPVDGYQHLMSGSSKGISAADYIKILRGQSKSAAETQPPSYRSAFMFTHMAQGTILDACYPSHLDLRKIDPMLNVDAPGFPPTCLVHGTCDQLIAIDVAREYYDALKKAGVRTEFIEIPDENHAFPMTMKVGSRTWQLSRRGFEFLESVLKEKEKEDKSLCRREAISSRL